MSKKAQVEKEHSSGTMAINKHAAVNRLSTMGSLKDTLREATANAYDAAAPKIQIYVDSKNNTVRIRDNGTGILGEIPENDLQALRVFLQDPNHIWSPESNPLVLFEKPTSALSFPYMMECAGLSMKSDTYTYTFIQNLLAQAGWIEKANESYTPPQGVFGIGILSSLGIAKRVIFRSRACLPLANFHYGKEFSSPLEVPAFELIAPNTSDLSLSYQIHRLDKFVEPYSRNQKEIEHGVELILEGVSERIRLDYLAADLGKFFSLILLSKKLVIEIIEVIYQKDTPVLKTHKVTPVILDGKPVILRGQESLEIEKDGFIARVTLFDVGKEGRVTPPVFVRRAMPLSPVTDFPNLFNGAWETGTLTGYVELFTPSDLGGEEISDKEYWLAQKTLPNLNSKLGGLVREVANLEPEIADWLAQMRDNKVNSKMGSLAQVFGSLLQEETRDGDFFRLNPSYRPSSKEPFPKQTEYIPANKKGIDLLIRNEQGEMVGYKFVFTLRVVKNNQTIGKYQFKGGHLELPLLDKADYSFYLDLPEGVKLAAGQANCVLVKIGSREYYPVRFYVITGEEKRVKKQLRNDIKTRFLSLGAHGPIWDGSNLENGIIGINADYPPLAELLDDTSHSSNIAMISAILADASVNAIVLYLYDKVDDTVLDRAQRLKNKLTQRLATEWKTRIKVNS